MTNDGYLYLVTGLVLATVAYILFHNRDNIRLYFASASTRRTRLEQARFGAQRDKEGMQDYERQVIIDILKDQLAHSRQDFSALQDKVDDLNEEIVKLKTAQAKDISEVKTNQIITNNRLEAYRILLSRIEENTRKR